MQARASKKGDLASTAHRVVQEATGQAEKTPAPEKNAAAVALGALGASKGGKARAATLSRRRKKEIARAAAKARWAKAKKS